MQLELICETQTTTVDLAHGITRLGGGPADDIVIAGLEPGLLKLELGQGQLTLTARHPVRVGAAVFPARVPRLLLDGEVVTLSSGVSVRRRVDEARRASRKNVGTAFVARGLLAGDLAPETTRAATFTCVTGLDQGQTFAVAFTESIIGRADDAHVRIRDRAASRRHAALVRVGNAWLLTPLSTTNGVFVNGVRVRRAQPLGSGDVVELGHTVLRFESAERAPEELTVIEPVAPVVSVEPLAPTPEAPAPLPTHRREQVMLAAGVLLSLAGLTIAALTALSDV
jgi:hypothetical protein